MPTPNSSNSSNPTLRQSLGRAAIFCHSIFTGALGRLRGTLKKFRRAGILKIFLARIKSRWTAVKTATAENFFPSATAPKLRIGCQQKIFSLCFPCARTHFRFVKPRARTFGPRFASVTSSRLGRAAKYGKRRTSLKKARQLPLENVPIPIETATAWAEAR